MTLASQSELPQLIVVAVVNALHLTIKAERIGVSVRPIEGMACYVIMISLIQLPLDTVLRLVEEAWSFVEQTNAPPEEMLELHKLMIQQILRRMSDELSDICTQGCVRVTKDPIFMPQEQVKDYLNRFRPRHNDCSTKREEDNVTLWMEKNDGRCNVGLPLDKNHSCPFMGSDKDKLSIRESLSVFREVLMKRLLIDENSELE
jgi:hypothetical protein